MAIFKCVTGCLADAGFHFSFQIKVNFHRRIINAFIHLLFKMLFLYCSELNNGRLH